MKSFGIFKCSLVFSIVLFLSSCSSPPSDVIEIGITNQFPSKAAYGLDDWNKVNSYTRQIQGEEVYYLEYKAKFKLKKEYRKYLNNGGGVSFSSEYYDSTGTVAFVRRGSKWYSF